MQTIYHAPGKGFLQASGILMIILASLLLLFLLLVGSFLGALGFMGAFGNLSLSELMDSLELVIRTGQGSAEILTAALSLIQLFFTFVGGIVGVALCNKPGVPALVCVLFGLILLVGSIFIMVLSNSLWFGLLGMILPLLYTIGAFLNLFGRAPAYPER